MRFEMRDRSCKGIDGMCYQPKHLFGSPLYAVAKFKDGGLYKDEGVGLFAEMCDLELSSIRDRDFKLRDLGRTTGNESVGVYYFGFGMGEECGANVILIKDFLDEARELVGEYYLIPSSIHEWLVYPKKIAPDKGELARMIEEVNDGIDWRDVLSYNVYEYDGEKVKVAYWRRTEEERKREW